MLNLVYNRMVSRLKVIVLLLTIEIKVKSWGTHTFHFKVSQDFSYML